MKLLVATLISTVSVVGGIELSDRLTPPATAVSGDTAISSVVRAARYDHLTNGTPWADALVGTAATLLDGEATVEGVTVQWEAAGYCYQANVPDAWTPVVVTTCEVPVTGTSQNEVAS